MVFTKRASSRAGLQGVDNWTLRRTDVGKIMERALVNMANDSEEAWEATVRMRAEAGLRGS